MGENPDIHRVLNTLDGWNMEYGLFCYVTLKFTSYFLPFKLLGGVVKLPHQGFYFYLFPGCLRSLLKVNPVDVSQS